MPNGPPSWRRRRQTDGVDDGDRLTWDPPGQGVWWLTREHFPSPVSGLFAALFPPMTLGWRRGAERLGLPPRDARWGAVNGWLYYSPGPRTLASEVALAGLDDTARVTLETRGWRAEVGRWTTTERPAVVATNRALQDEDPASLGGPALATHLQRVVAHAADVGALHFEHLGIGVAAGFLVQAADGWGLDVGQVVALLGGASPASAAAAGHVDRIADALVEAGAAPADLHTLADVRVASPAAAEALDGYLGDHGLRLVHGHDLCEPTLVERPDLVVASIIARLTRPPAAADVTAGADVGRSVRPGGGSGPTREAAGGPSPEEAAVEAVRRRVPAGERDRFDELLADARLCYQLRDDDGALCFTWPLGLVRRAVRETGARLVAAGVLAAADHLFEATPDEIAALVTAPTRDRVDAPGAAAPSDVDGAVLAARAERRTRAALADPPVQLGAAPARADASAPPLPVHVATLAAAQEAYFAAASTDGSVGPAGDAPGRDPAGEGTLRGLGVGSGTAAGRAFVATGPDQALEGLRPGDVLVTVTTTASYNALFPIVAAVVTGSGGLFSHAAILARESGLPAVVGVPDVVATVRTGDHVEVDAAAGTVRISRPAPPDPPV